MIPARARIILFNFTIITASMGILSKILIVTTSIYTGVKPCK